LHLTNCIIWGNEYGSLSPYGNNYDITYSCVEGDLLPGTGNINIDPCFIDFANNNYHIDPNSRCIDMGNPNGNYDGETDIDGQNRVMDGDANGTVIVDMGADEYSVCGLADFNLDHIVNFLDYVIFANAWLTQTSNPNYNDSCDLVDDSVIDYKDLKVFCGCWLWPMQGFLMGEDQGFGGESMGLEGESFAVESAEQTQAKSVSQPVDLEVIAEMLDEVWASGALNAIMTEQEYLEFRQEALESLQQ
jgi:hypothetical protein